MKCQAALNTVLPTTRPFSKSLSSLTLYRLRSLQNFQIKLHYFTSYTRLLHAQPLLLLLVWCLPQDVLMCKTANHKAPCYPAQQNHFTSNASCCSLPINWLHCLLVTQNVQLVGPNSTTAGINISAAGYIWRHARRLSLQQATSDVKLDACLCSRLHLTWRSTTVSAAGCIWRDVQLRSLQQVASDVTLDACLYSRLHLTWRLSLQPQACSQAKACVNRIPLQNQHSTHTHVCSSLRTLALTVQVLRYNFVDGVAFFVPDSRILMRKA